MRHSNPQPRRAASGARSLATLSLLAAALLATGCSQSRFGGPGLQSAAPQPLPPAPSGTVQTGALPPTSPIDTQPIAPTDDPTQVASVDPVAPTAPATGGGQPISANALIGNWTTNVGGASCATFFGLTDLGSGQLGGTRGCSGDLAKFRTWKVAGNSATLRDQNGSTIATLTRTGDKSFAGRTSSGESFTLTR